MLLDLRETRTTDIMGNNRMKMSVTEINTFKFMKWN